MTRRLTCVTFAGADRQPMGMQRYELEILGALAQAATAGGPRPSWDISQLTVGSMRAANRGDASVPMRMLEADRGHAARALGRLIYRGAGLIHRFDLRLPPAPGPEVVTVHDLPPLRYPDEGHLPRWAVTSASRARLVICPSQFAADEIRSLLGVRDIAVVPNGVGSAFTSAAGEREGVRGEGAPFVLHAGGASARKNLAALAGAWPFVRREHPDLELLLAGPDDPRRDAAFDGVAGVTMLGYRSPEQIAGLMRAAQLVVVPSVYEGFGLPALEAMAAGAPVVAVRRGALPEVCGSAAVLVEPDRHALADGIVRVAGDDRLRAVLRQQGAERAAQFSWSRSAQGHLDAYERAFSP